MFHVTTNKTEESWNRGDLKKARPSENSDEEILGRITKIIPQGMSHETAVDFFKMQLGTWRRFYKEDDNVQVDEAYTAENKRVTQVKSLNLVFYVREVNGSEIKITSGFYDTIKTSCKKLFEEKPASGDSIEMLEGAKESPKQE